MSESRRTSTTPIVLMAVAVLATGLAWFAVERVGRIAALAEEVGALPHSWHLVAVQGFVLAVLCLAGVALWLLRRRDEAVAGEAGLLAVLDAAPNGVALIDESGRIVLVNAQVEVFGTAPGMFATQ